MAEKKRGSAGSAGGLSGRRLKELAKEASRHLDEVLPGGEAAPELVGEGRTSHTAAESGGRVGGRSAVREAGADASAGDGTARDESGRARALVAHVSPGVAGVLATVLKHMGLNTQVATTPAEVESAMSSGRWDLVFVQGTPQPYPGKRVMLSVISRSGDSTSPVFLLGRRGESLAAEAAGSGALGIVEWPFDPAKVRRTLQEVLSREGGSRRTRPSQPRRRADDAEHGKKTGA